jgi:integrase
MTDQQHEQPEKKRQRKSRSRSRGEGSVFERKGEGRKKPWVAQVTVNGKPKPIGYFKTQSEAIAAKNKALRELEQGTWVDSSRQTLAEYLDYWLEHVHKPAIEPNTYTSDRSALKRRIIPGLGHIQMQKLTVRHIQMFYSDLLTKEKLAPSSVCFSHRVLHVALEHAVHEGLVARNVCEDVKLPRQKKREQQVLSLEQASEFWTAVENNQMKTIVMLAVTTTLRRGEVLALHWQDIDLKARLLHVRRGLIRIKGQGLIEKEPKTEHSQRKITLPIFVAGALEKHRTNQQEARQAAGDTWQEHDLVFCKKNGVHISMSMLNRHFAALLKTIGLPHMRFHDLRHSAVTILLMMGVPPHVVQEIAGHSDVHTTLSVYAKVLPGQQAEAMQKWDSALGTEERYSRMQEQWKGYSTQVQYQLEALLKGYGDGAAQIAVNIINLLRE